MTSVAGVIVIRSASHASVGAAPRWWMEMPSTLPGATASAATARRWNCVVSIAPWPVVIRTSVPPCVYSASAIVASLPTADGLAART